MKMIDMSCQKFGRLLVLRPDRNGKKLKWQCICDCGAISIVDGVKQRSGETKSCGCLASELQSERITKANLKHGHNIKGKQSKTHKTWTAMLHRCRSPNYSSYKDYGGRGISVCERWQKFENFLLDMGERPEGMSIDRIDVNGNYEPSNCRWATPSQQQKNQRRHVKN